jgi:hypothetical protein
MYVTLSLAHPAQADTSVVPATIVVVDTFGKRFTYTIRCDTCIDCGAGIPKGAMYCSACQPIGVPDQE